MALTLKQYIDNPMGKGAYIAGRDFIIADLNNRFHKLVQDKKIELNIYRDRNDYFYHFIIPSESVDKMTYDIVLKFTCNKEYKFDVSIKNYDIQFFSNCPSFTYTHAYAFSVNELLVQELRDKYDVGIFNYVPMTRNPNISVTYEKSIYYACKYLLDSPELLVKTHANKVSTPYNKMKLMYVIRSDKKIDMEYKTLKKEQSDNKKKEDKEKLNKLKKDLNRKPSKPKKTPSKSNTEHTNKVRTVKAMPKKAKIKGKRKR